jgi:MEDS: MEthanogen/methylotroph, DcmR Sensory domain
MMIHDLILYKNIDVLKDWCLQFCREALLESNEIVLILSDYDSIKYALDDLTNNNFNPRNMKNEGSLVIVDSKKGFYSMLDRFVGIIIMVKMLLTRSETRRKNGVTVISDTGIFFHLNRIDDLFKHESMIFSTVSNLRVKIICAYNTTDYEGLNDGQKQLLQSSHSKIIPID